MKKKKETENPLFSVDLESLGRRVYGEGPKAAKVLVIAEAPGKDEEIKGRPLVGPTGQMVERWWRQVGLQRELMRLDNVVQRRPPGNKLEKLEKHEIEAWAEDLRSRLAELPYVEVVVAVGNLALWALTGRTGITKWRGSPLETVLPCGRVVVCIPTIHPAALFRQPSWERRCVRDWEKVARAAKDPSGAAPTVSTHKIKPTIKEVEDFAQFVLTRKNGTPMAVDIETPGNIIGCVGFALAKGASFTIPTTPAYWGMGDAHKVWVLVREMLESRNTNKIFQNGLFDTYWLKRLHGIAVKGYVWDTLAMHHALEPNDDHDLAYMASVFTNRVYWKEEAKDPESVQKYTSNAEALWAYNGMDCCAQFELWEVFRKRLVQEHRLGFYLTHYARMLQPLLSIMLTGILVDEEQRVRMLGKLMVERVAAEIKMEGIAQEKLCAKVAVSGKKLIEWLKGRGVKIPKKKQTTGMWADSVDETALLKIMKKAYVPKEVKEVAGLVLKHRQIGKQQEVLDSERLDKDHRYRSSYKFTTETGRLASAKNPMGTGSNAQNIDRALRRFFVPKKKHVFLEFDLSQAEWRVVGMLTGDTELMQLANTPPWSFDVHTYNAAIIFEKAVEEVTRVERGMGKRFVHAVDYGMEADTASEQLLKDGFVVPPKRCQEYISRYLERYPAIPLWQRDIRAELLRNRRLENSWGRIFDVSFERLNEDTYRRGYSFKPQSEVVDWLNQYGLVPLYEWRKDWRDFEINAHVHDALLVSVDRDEAWEVAQFVVKSLQTTREIGAGSLSMFVEIKMGRSWKGDVEWKQLPSRGEFEQKLKELLE